MGRVISLVKVLSLFVLLITLNARENPFFPAEGERDIPLATNKENSKTPLKQASISLPSQARVLQKVTIEFKNLDGSVDTKSIELDNSIDWHLPVLVSQKQIESPLLQEQKKSELVESKKKSGESKTLVSERFLKFIVSGKSLKIETKNEAIRNFLLASPHRIVVDFKSSAEVADFTKKEFDTIFKEVRIGNHKGFYRVVFELDGLYRYEFKKVTDGYVVELK